jgi:two-component system response regulator DesR
MSMVIVNNHIKVLVIDDSESIRTSLKAFLSAFADFDWVGESSDGQDSLCQIEGLQPDVVLLDAALSHSDVARLTSLIRQRFPATQVIGITNRHENDSSLRMIAAGAVLCIAKTVPAQQMADAIRTAYRPYSTC